jgi:hypothetical protein
VPGSGRCRRHRALPRRLREGRFLRVLRLRLLCLRCHGCLLALRLRLRRLRHNRLLWSRALLGRSELLNGSRLLRSAGILRAASYR